MMAAVEEDVTFDNGEDHVNGHPGSAMMSDDNVYKILISFTK